MQSPDQAACKPRRARSFRFGHGGANDRIAPDGRFRTIAGHAMLFAPLTLASVWREWAVKSPARSNLRQCRHKHVAASDIMDRLAAINRFKCLFARLEGRCLGHITVGIGPHF